MTLDNNNKHYYYYYFYYHHLLSAPANMCEQNCEDMYVEHRQTGKIQLNANELPLKNQHLFAYTYTPFHYVPYIAQPIFATKTHTHTCKCSHIV